MLVRTLALISSLALVSCDSIPRDANDTSERIKASGQLKVGIVSGTSVTRDVHDLLRAVADHHDARVVTKHASASHLIRSLEDGDLHLVLGDFGRSSLTSKEVSLSPAIGAPEPKNGKVPVLRLARKHGENRLILLTDRLAEE